MNGISLGRERFGDIKHRKNVRNLTVGELQELRTAFEGVYRISDNRGYQYFAGIHGLPLPYQCEHGNLLFLPWHRAYLYTFEKALQEIVPGVMLPYWDWTSEKSISEGIPKAYSDQNTVDGSSNPLFSGHIVFENRNTTRDVGDPPDLRRLAQEIDRAMNVNFFARFSRDISNPHGRIHMWVDGDMSDIEYAAFDPIFWVHHANVDRQWAEWQNEHPDAATPNLNTVLSPFDMTVRDTIDFRGNLGYDYIADEIFEAVEIISSTSNEETNLNSNEELPENESQASSSTSNLEEKFNNSTTQVSLEKLDKEFKSATLELHNVHHSRGSFETRVFINQPDADHKTSIDGNPHYAGSLYFFGHVEECSGDKGHCDIPKYARKKFDIRPPHHLTPFKLYMEITECLRRVTKKSKNPAISFVSVDSKGKLKKNGIRLEGISLVLKD